MGNRNVCAKMSRLDLCRSSEFVNDRWAESCSKEADERTQTTALAWILSIALFSVAGCNRVDLPDAGTYQSIKNSLTEHLDKEVLPFWVSDKINDESYGGYLPYLDKRLLPTGKVEGHVIVQLRLLYVHAVAISRTSDEGLKTRLLGQYHRKFAFLKTQYWDNKNGGFFNYSSDHRARSLYSLKETRSQVHAIYFLAESYLLVGHEEVLELARAVFSLIDLSGHDTVYGGYSSYYELSQDHRRNSVKTLGIQMHMLLALSRLHQATAETVYIDRAHEIADILVSRFEIPGSRGNAYNALTYDWHEIPPDGELDTKIVYGHSAEVIWYMLESATVFNRDVQALRPWLTRLTDALLDSGVSSSGAVYWTGAYRGKAEDKTIWWWAQAEAMIALLRVYEVTGDIRYWNGFQKVRLWTFRHVVLDHSGTWVAFMDRWGFRHAPLRAGSHWQTGFHVTRALLQCEQSLDHLLARNKT
jgi:mannose/cellobiose epimerase-like protein (N-acyl-D-glucosamine 2-epimerase family)